MNTVTVSASKEYQVLIGGGLLSSLGKHAAALKAPGKAVIISDSNVWPLYGKVAENSLQNAGFETIHYCFPAGESSKTAETYLNILNFLAESQLTRSDMIIALGGGVVGDVTGFASATYLRGISYIQVPTTLLAMVDSSVGGKTAIDLPAGKNLAGAFYQPSLVLCDTDVLDSLPENVFRDGCAEVIKYGILYDSKLFMHLKENGLCFDREAVITRCVELKRNVVAEDEFDTGSRQKLNLGHTFGHAVEKLSNFTVTHGQAVAIGMAMAARTAQKRRICNAHTVNEIQTVLDGFGLPSHTAFSANDLRQAALSDKKRTGGTVNLILPERIGTCTILPTPIENLQSFIEEGL
ncbi:MAG: 3-dehydroquinate synthase [Oscillospiraceae bacterium]|nr:3-dehydroquinate synthase [Oscillospiraceae bacterium]